MTRLFVEQPLPLPGSAYEKATTGLLNIVLKYFFVRPSYVLTVLQTDQTDLIVWKLMTLSGQKSTLVLETFIYQCVEWSLPQIGLFLESLGYV